MIIKPHNILILFASLALTLNACSNDRPTRPAGRVTTNDVVEAKKFLLDAKSFNLQHVIGMITNQSVTDLGAIETAINKDDAISSVDLDKDDKTDWVGINEREGGAIDFVAYKSSNPNGQPTVIASITITRNAQTNEAFVSGGYPDYVEGFDSGYYESSMPWRPRVGGLYIGYGYRTYVPRPMLSISVQRQRRISLAARTTRTTRTIKQKSRPARFKIKSAAKTKQRLKAQRTNARPAPRGTTFGSHANQTTKLKNRAPTKARAKATGFGAKRPAPKRPAARPAPKRPTRSFFGGSSSPSRSRSTPSRRSRPTRSRSRRR